MDEAQCDDIIAKLPQGIDTVIGTKGVYLSGGEQQWIAIACIMLKNASILILDEATAFADPENETLVQQTFLKEMHIVRYADDFLVFCPIKDCVKRARIAVTK